MRLGVDHTVRCLQTDFELFSVEQIWLTTLFRERFKIVRALTGLLVDELTIVIVTELTALHGNARLDQRSKYSKARLRSMTFEKTNKSGYNASSWIVTPGKSHFQPTSGS